MNNPLHVAIFFWRWALSYKCWHVLFVNLSSLYSLSLRKIQKKILQTFWIYSCCYQGKRKKAPLICYKLNRYLTTKEPPQKKRKLLTVSPFSSFFLTDSPVSDKETGGGTPIWAIPMGIVVVVYMVAVVYMVCWKRRRNVQKKDISRNAIYEMRWCKCLMKIPTYPWNTSLVTQNRNMKGFPSLTGGRIIPKVLLGRFSWNMMSRPLEEFDCKYSTPIGSV